LGDDFRMLDVVGLRFDDAGTDELVLGHAEFLQHTPLVTVSRVGAFEEHGLGLSRPDDVDDVFDRHVVVVGAWIVPPTQMHAQLLCGDIAHCVVQRLDVGSNGGTELIA
jgi:hypothetical protein